MGFDLCLTWARPALPRNYLSAGLKLCHAGAGLVIGFSESLLFGVPTRGLFVGARRYLESMNLM